MYHIVICDDEPIFLTQISEMIIDILASMGESCEIRKYTSISELKNTLQNTPKSCDILILDIMLGENNGISFAECLRDTENQIPVIFISSSKEFVFDAYSAEPVGYILKPVSRQKLAEALTRAIRHLIPKSIIIDTPSRTVSFHIRDITYIEIINKELQIHLRTVLSRRYINPFLQSVKFCRKISSCNVTDATLFLCMLSVQSDALKSH